MIGPRQYLTRMVTFVLFIGGLAVVLLPSLSSAFMANPPLNGAIVAVLLFGTFYSFRQVVLLYPEVAWIQRLKSGRLPKTMQAPRLLGPMAAMLATRSLSGDGSQTDEKPTDEKPAEPKLALRLSAMSLRSLLDSIGARLEESRDLSRYLIGLLIFLGLLGTFWGLLHTIGSIGDVIANLSIGGVDLTTALADLKQQLEAPLDGMSTAFSSSLFGLAGSLILGFLDLQMNQAQNRFYNELEEWLAGQTQMAGDFDQAGLEILTIGSQEGIGGAGAGGRSPYLTALIERNTDTLAALQRAVTRGDEERRAAQADIKALNERLAVLIDELVSGSGVRLEERALSHLHNTEVLLGRLLEEGNRHREQTAGEVKNEIRLLSRTVSALAEEEEP